jgi:hypothetical protein
MDVMILYQLNICLQPMALFVIVSLIIEPIQQKKCRQFCKSTLNIETNIETLKTSTLTLTLSRFSMLKFSTLTLY